MEVKKRRRKDQMVNLVVVCLLQSAAASLITAELFEVRGQRVCRVDRGRPCYKLAYFSDPGRRLSFLEAKLACRRDGGELLSVESPAEQRIIEQLVTELRPSDGDFWIGLRRNHGDTENVDDCPSQYYWTDGSHASFRNWHWDEPSCGYEVCVVMYHQPSAPPGLGGLYMFQWNDDNCDTKNNFICKYTAEKAPEPSPNTAHPEAPPLSLSPLPTTFDTEEKRQTPALNMVYIVLPTIPLLMVLLIATVVFCFKLLARRRKRREQQTEVCPSDPGSCPSQAQPPDVYNVIRSQQEADLAGTRPHTKNTSFLGSSPDMSPGDYDNMGGLRDTESGFVTLASTESNFLLTSELYDLSLGRRQDNSDIYHKSLDRQGNGEVYNNSLGRHGNRETSDNGLGCHGNGGTYNNRLGIHGCVVKSSELYNTSHYRDSLYQTSLDRYGNPEHHERSLGRHGNDASVDCYGKEATVGYYGNEGSLGGKCYKEWLDSDSN
ncbi:layilin [Salvelinus alpinus]|uniref:layilin n=1 Tax=Salvelinus alpinus TaxID=8036 RepID=UPI0039FCA0E1